MQTPQRVWPFATTPLAPHQDAADEGGEAPELAPPAPDVCPDILRVGKSCDLDHEVYDGRPMAGRSPIGW